MDCIHYFAAGFAEARAKFREAALSAGARLVTFAHPGRAPDGGDLSCDVALIGDPAARRVLLANSATHGVEGFCGSGAMVGWLRSGGAERLPAGVRAVLVHAINPHGFAWLRRVTEDNVDLNRNFIDHAQPRPENPNYAAMADWIVPPAWDPPTLAERARVLDAYKARHGAFALQSAISAGQYSHPDGVFFGGHRPTWSNLTFRRIIAELVAPADHVGFIDFHTGLGPYGTAELIAGADPEGLRRVIDWYTNNVTAPELGNSSSPSLSGVIKNAVTGMLPDAVITSMTAEYGTYPAPVVLDAVCADAWLHRSGDLDSPLGRELKARMRKAFYPDEDDWKELVWVRARQILARAAAGLARA